MISVHEAEKLSLQEIEQFLLAAKEVRFEASQREEIYGWVERLLCQQEYARQGRRARGLLRRYLGKMTGLSRAQLTRLVGRYLATGRVRISASRRHRFPTRYTRADIDLCQQFDICPGVPNCAKIHRYQYQSHASGRASNKSIFPRVQDARAGRSGFYIK
jgi:hypothetical protein